MAKKHKKQHGKDVGRVGCLSYEIAGMQFICRMVDISDKWALDGLLPVLPDVDPAEREAAAKETLEDSSKMLELLEYADQTLERCGVIPQFIRESPVEIPDNCQPLAELNALIRLELFTQLRQDSGFTKEAADEIRPTSGTEAAS